jgi:hypothetical protein
MPPGQYSGGDGPRSAGGGRTGGGTGGGLGGFGGGNRTGAASAALGLGSKLSSPRGAAGSSGVHGGRKPRKLANFSEEDLSMLTAEQLAWLMSGGEI